MVCNSCQEYTHLFQTYLNPFLLVTPLQFSHQLAAWHAFLMRIPIWEFVMHFLNDLFMRRATRNMSYGWKSVVLVHPKITREHINHTHYHIFGIRKSLILSRKAGPFDPRYEVRKVHTLPPDDSLLDKQYHHRFNGIIRFIRQLMLCYVVGISFIDLTGNFFGSNFIKKSCGKDIIAFESYMIK